MLRKTALAAALAFALPFSAVAAETAKPPPGEASGKSPAGLEKPVRAFPRLVRDGNEALPRGLKRRTKAVKKSGVVKEAAKLDLAKPENTKPTATKPTAKSKIVQPKAGLKKPTNTTPTKTKSTETKTDAAASSATSTTAAQGSTSATGTTGTKAKPNAQSLSNPTAAGGQ